MWDKVMLEAGKLIRKLIFAAAGTWILKLTEMGVITDLDIDRAIQIIVAILAIVITMLWTEHIKPWVSKLLTKKVTTPDVV